MKHSQCRNGVNALGVHRSSPGGEIGYPDVCFIKASGSLYEACSRTGVQAQRIINLYADFYFSSPEPSFPDGCSGDAS